MQSLSKVLTQFQSTI
jgi:hypothetical protein